MLADSIHGKQARVVFMPLHFQVRNQ